MSRVFLCLFTLFILSIAIRFGDCESSTQSNVEYDDTDIKPGTDGTRLAMFEKVVPLKIKNKLWEKVNSQPKAGCLSKIIQKFAIFPGTLWCGSGNIAKQEEQLGIFKGTDACCRNHDNCSNNILAGKTKGNLFNNGLYTRSACTCDFEFHDCLKKTKSPIAFQVGLSYFNVLKPQCFKCVNQEKNCNPKDDTECKESCKKYEWVDNNKYIF